MICCCAGFIVWPYLAQAVGLMDPAIGRRQYLHMKSCGCSCGPPQCTQLRFTTDLYFMPAHGTSFEVCCAFAKIDARLGPAGAAGATTGAGIGAEGGMPS